jgi:hypothetical protein
VPNGTIDSDTQKEIAKAKRLKKEYYDDKNENIQRK